MASQHSNSQGSSSSQSERYKVLLNPVRDPVKNFEIDICDLLEDFMQVVESNSQNIICGSQGGVNFAEAALLLQASSLAYGRKVEYLYTLTKQLCEAVHSDKKAASSYKAKGKHMLLTGQHTDSEFVLADDIQYQQNDYLIADYESYNNRYNMTAIKPVPLALMPFDEREKGDLNIKTMLGEVIGNLRDYQMNVSDLLNVGCVFLPTIVFKPEDGEAPIFSNSTFLSMADQDDDDPIDVSNASFRCSGSDGQSQPLSSTVDPSPLDMNGMDIESDDNYSVHDDPISDSPIFLTPSPEVDIDDNTESQKTDVPMQKQSKRQALKLAAKHDKAVENPCAIKSKDVKNQIVTLKEERKTSIERIIKKYHGKRRQFSRHFIHYIHLASKNLKKFPLEPGIDAEITFEFMVSSVCRCERRAFLILHNTLVINTEIPPKIDIPGLPASCPESPHPDGNAPDDDYCSISSIVDDGACASPVFPPTPEDEEPLTLEFVLRTYVSDYLKGTQKFSMTTALSQSVKEWKEKIKPMIEEQNEREVFDVYQYGTCIIDKFANNNRKQSLSFSSICKGKSRWEVCRYFLASLILANNSNVEISAYDIPSGMHDVSLTLLSRKRHQGLLDALGHKPGEHE